MAQRNEQLGSNIRQFAVDKQEVSWRQQELFLHGNELKTITFDDTKPNMFFIQNPSDTIIHVGISHIPTVNTYEFRVNSHNTKAFGRPIRTNRLYLLNMTNVDVSITLFSVYDKFDLNILNDIDFDFNGLMEIKSDGFIKGFSNGVELPTGNNHIGSVTVRDSVLSEATNQILNKLSSHVNNTDVFDVLTSINNSVSKNDSLSNLYELLVQLDNKFTTHVNNTDVFDVLTSINNSVSKNDSLSNLYELLVQLDNKFTTHVNNTDVYDVLTTLKNVVSKDTNVIELCNKLDNVSQVIATDSMLIQLQDLLTDIYDMLIKISNPFINFEYLNNVTSFTFTASNDYILEFQYLCNDKLDTDIKVNDNTILTLFSGEKVTDFKIELAKDDVVTFVSTDGSYRLKYYVKGV